VRAQGPAPQAAAAQVASGSLRRARNTGTDLFRVICEADTEGIVAKQASARYTPEATTWVKIKNRQYSQAIGREDFFNHRKPNVRALIVEKTDSGSR
jgi:hypothetical protein